MGSGMVLTRWEGLRIFLAIVTALILQALITNCSRQEAQLPKLRVSYIENASCWPLFVALENGLFQKLGVEVIAVKAANSTEAINAMLAGQVDASIENTYSALFAVEANSPGTIRLFLPCSETREQYVSHLLVSMGSNISRVEQLKGKRIGTYSGSTQLLTLKLFVRKHMKLDPERDVKIIQVDPSMQVQALAAGQFDALFTVEPFAAIALSKGIARSLVPYARGFIIDPFPAGASSTRSQIIIGNREALRKAYEAMAYAAEFIDKHHKEAYQILAKYTALDVLTAAKVGGYRYYQFDNFTDNDRALVQQLADMYFEEKILPKRIDVAEMFLTLQELR